MSFSLYALLPNSSPGVSNDSLFSDLEDFFKKDKKVSIKWEELPFKKGKSIRLQWGKWPAILTYKEGEDVLSDSREINKIVGSSAPFDLSQISRRIHVFFGDDPEKEYTNETVDVMSFLEKIEGVVIFDPKNKKLLDFNSGA